MSANVSKINNSTFVETATEENSEKEKKKTRSPIFSVPLSIGAGFAVGAGTVIMNELSFNSFIKDAKKYNCSEIEYCNKYADKVLEELNKDGKRRRIMDMSEKDMWKRLYARQMGKTEYIKSERQIKHLEESVFNSSSRDLANYNLKAEISDQIHYSNRKSSSILEDVNSVIEGKDAIAQNKYNKVFINRKKIAQASFHELGHLKVGSALMYTSKITKLLIPFILLGALKKKDNNENENKAGVMNFVKEHCAGLMFLTQVPTLLDEGLASINGIHLAKKAGMKPSMIKRIAKTNLLGFLTYAIIALGTTLATYTMSKVRDAV